VCGGQRITCSHRNHDPWFSRWTGIWPGKAEADYLKMDLNEFYKRGYEKIFFVKPKQVK
jgi:hypothetical protein